MAKGIRIRPSKHPRYAWEAAYSVMVNGARSPKRRYFKTKTEAQDFRARHTATLESAGTEIGELRSDELRAVSIWRERRRTFPPDIVLPALDEIVRKEMDRIAGTIASVTLRQAVDATIQRRESECRKARTIKGLSQQIRRFERETGPGRLIATFQTPEINGWLLGLTDPQGQPVSPRTRANYRKGLSTLFAEAVRKGWCERNPVTLADRPQVPQPERIAILTPEELASLLRVAEPVARAAIVLGGLCGLRSSEIAEIDWSLVNLQEGHIRVNRGKTGKRLVPLSENARQWLLPLAHLRGRVTGEVTPGRLYIPVGRAFERSGVIRERNCLRHSFCSYRLALTQNLAQTALEAGNSPAILQRHYHELVTRKQAEAWFAVRPGNDSNIIAIAH